MSNIIKFAMGTPKKIRPKPQLAQRSGSPAAKQLSFWPQNLKMCFCRGVYQPKVRVAVRKQIDL